MVGKKNKQKNNFQQLRVHSRTIFFNKSGLKLASIVSNDFIRPVKSSAVELSGEKLTYLTIMKSEGIENNKSLDYLFINLYYGEEGEGKEKNLR